MSLYQQVDQCRSCGAKLADVFLDLGLSPVADNLANTPGEATAFVPLQLVWCHQCYLVQLKSHVKPEVVYNDAYPYFSSAIASLVERSRKTVNSICQRYSLAENSTVVEIAANDGYLLQHFSDFGVRVLGVEPCESQAQESIKKGIETRQEFFTAALAVQLVKQLPSVDLVIANNVAAHVNDINDFMRGVATLIGDFGHAVFEVHYLGDLLKNRQFDTIYHQHIFYYSLTSFRSLLRRWKMEVLSVEHIDAYGGSLRLHTGKVGVVDHSVEQLMLQEQELGIVSGDNYQNYAVELESTKTKIKLLVNQLVADGKTIVGYGAAAKASTLLHACGFDVGQIQCIVDVNPDKHGRYMPGTSIRVEEIASLDDFRPDYILIFAWNYAEEVMRQLASYHYAGTKFILPVPDPVIV